MDIKEIKRIGREAFKANYWRCVIVAFLVGLFVTGTAASTGNTVKNTDTTQITQSMTNSTEDERDITEEEQAVVDAIKAMPQDQLAILGAAVMGTLMVITLIMILLRIFLFNPLEVGGYRFFKKNIQEPGVSVGVITEGFGDYGRTFLTLFLRDLFLCLWFVLFFIPGFIKTYSYRLVPYIIKDNPELSATEAITRSRELMNGHKWEAFVLDLSFIGWYLLGFLTFDILNIFWTAPYHESSKAEFYLKLLEN